MKYIIIAAGLVAGGLLPATAQTFGVSYTTEVQYAPTSGKSNWCNKLRMDFSLPIYKNGELNAASIHIYKANSQRVIDDRMTFSNIEEQNNPFAIATLGYTQKFGSSVLFLGVRNMNEDYFASPVTSFFTNSSCGIYPTISTNYPIANYPLSALCLDYKGRFGRWGVKGSLYSGAGHNGWDKKDNPFIVDFKQEGVFGITELSYKTNYENYFCGVSLHNRLFLCDAYAEQSEETTTWQTQKKTSVTWWGYAEQALWAEAGHKMNLLVQYSQNSSVDNSCKWYVGLGATGSYWNGKQHQHDFGILFFVSQFSGAYETASEITYRLQLCPNTFIQPAIHLIRNSAGFHSVFMLRLSSAIEWNLK